MEMKVKLKCISEEHLKYKLELGCNVTISGNDWYTKETNNMEDVV